MSLKKTILLSFCYLLSICHYYFLNSRLGILIVCLLCIMRYKYCLKTVEKCQLLLHILLCQIFWSPYPCHDEFCFSRFSNIHIHASKVFTFICKVGFMVGLRKRVSISLNIYFCSDPVFCTTILASATIFSLHLNDLFFHCIRVWITRKSS